MSDPRDLTTLANLKGWLYEAGVTTPTATDTLLERLITACSVFMQGDNQIGYPIASASYNETRNGTGGTRMLLRRSPVTAVSLVSIDGVSISARLPLANGGYYGYIFDDISVMVCGGIFFPRGYGNVVFGYTAGYPVTPPDLEQACIDIIGDWFKYKDRIGQLSMGIEGQTISFTNVPITARAKGVINNYRQVVPIAT